MSRIRLLGPVLNPAGVTAISRGNVRSSLMTGLKQSDPHGAGASFQRTAGTRATGTLSSTGPRPGTFPLLGCPSKAGNVC